jgi:TonB family protein
MMFSGALARTCWGLLIVLVGALEAACASSVVAYPGPRKPAQAVARLHARDFEIEEVDGYRSTWTSPDFEITPGIHMAQVRMSARRSRGEVSSDGSLRVCFIAQAGHTYAVVPRAFATGVGHGLWYPQVADETSNTWAPSQSLKPTETVCDLHKSQPILRIGWPVGIGNIRATAMDEREECFQQVKERVAPHWKPVEEYAQRNPAAPELDTRKWVTVLHVQLRADGSLMGVQVALPSGSDPLDQIAISAVQKAQPFPAPSPEVVKRAGMLTLPMAFEIRPTDPSQKAP